MVNYLVTGIVGDLEFLNLLVFTSVTLLLMRSCKELYLPPILTVDFDYYYFPFNIKSYNPTFTPDFIVSSLELLPLDEELT